MPVRDGQTVIAQPSGRNADRPESATGQAAVCKGRLGFGRLRQRPRKVTLRRRGGTHRQSGLDMSACAAAAEPFRREVPLLLPLVSSREEPASGVTAANFS